MLPAGSLPYRDTTDHSSDSDSNSTITQASLPSSDNAEVQVVAPTPMATPQSTFKPAKPTTFNGGKRNHAEVIAFLKSCELHYALTNTTSDTTRVYGAISYFEAGSAAQNWAAPFIGTDDEETPDWMKTWVAFKDELILQFGDPHDDQTSWKRFTTLKQITSVRAYATHFRMATERLKISEYHAMLQFRGSLKNEIRDALLGKTFANLNDFINQAIQVDEERNSYHAGGHTATTTTTRSTTPATRPNTNQTTSSSTFAPSQPAPRPGNLSTTSRPSVGPVPMDIDSSRSSKRGPLSDVDKQYRRTNNLCLYCGLPNHYATNCPSKPQSNGRAGSTVSLSPSDSASQVGSGHAASSSTSQDFASAQPSEEHA